MDQLDRLTLQEKTSSVRGNSLIFCCVNFVSIGSAALSFILHFGKVGLM